MYQRFTRAAFVLALMLTTFMLVDFSAHAQRRRRTTPTRPQAVNPISRGDVVEVSLNTPLNTKNLRGGERFTATVTSPAEARGATVYGYVSQAKRSGRIRGRGELTLNFSRLTLRNGRSFPFSGLVESIRTADGEEIRTDNEGTVEDDDNQTERTVKRTGIGAGVGAIIGGIAGGGKGVAIGAAVGGGAGAGSVILQGRQDLNLPRGTRMFVRATR